MKKILTILTVFSTLLMLTVPVFASESKPYKDFIPDNEYFIIGIDREDEDTSPDMFYAVAYNGDRYSKVNWQYRAKSTSSGSSFYIDLYLKGVTNTQAYSTVSIYQYSNDSKSWNLVNSFNANNTLTDINSAPISHGVAGSYAFNWTAQIMESNVNIYDWNGDLVFPQTPALEVPTVLEALMNLQTTVFGTMKILVLCGVGLIVSLLGLKLFGRVFAIFHP